MKLLLSPTLTKKVSKRNKQRLAWKKKTGPKTELKLWVWHLWQLIWKFSVAWLIRSPLCFTWVQRFNDGMFLKSLFYCKLISHLTYSTEIEPPLYHWECIPSTTSGFPCPLCSSPNIPMMHLFAYNAVVLGKLGAKWAINAEQKSTFPVAQTTTWNQNVPMIFRWERIPDQQLVKLATRYDSACNGNVLEACRSMEAERATRR